MANFKYYNIQLLPLDTQTTGNVGVEGYKKLFKSIGHVTRSAIQEKRLETISAPLRNDMYFVPFHLAIEESYASGQFLKFNHIDALRDLYTGDEVQQVGTGITSKRLTFDFVFDFKRHILAIARAKGIPSTNPLIKALEYLIVERAQETFPKHTVRINELTESESLEQVFEADGFKRVEVTVTFSNSDETEAAWERELEQDLRDKNVHDVEHVEKSAKETEMTDMSKMARGLVGLATKYGNATIRYIKDQVSHLYQMKNFPVTIEIAQRQDETEIDFYRKIHRSIREADTRAKRGSAKSNGENT